MKSGTAFYIRVTTSVDSMSLSVQLLFMLGTKHNVYFLCIIRRGQAVCVSATGCGVLFHSAPHMSESRSISRQAINFSVTDSYCYTNSTQHLVLSITLVC